MSGTRTPDELLQRALRRDGVQPVIIWYGPDGARVELSTKSLANAVAKAANLLAGELEPEDPVRIDLPLHWQASVWLAACAAGAWPIVIGQDHPAALTITSDPADVPGRVALVSLDPLGRPNGEVAPGILDAASDVRAMPDQFFAAPPQGPDDAALRLPGLELSARDVVDETVELAARLALNPGDRFTTNLAPLDLPGVLGLWLLPLLTGATAVLVAGDPAAAAGERPVADLASVAVGP